MDNHPIPQDVTGFQFKLIGNMTVKQFAYLITGFILAAIIFKLPGSMLIKFPFCLFFAGLGVGLAYFPVSGRPMDMMIGNYIKALFRPTQFIYGKVGGQLYLPNRTQFPTPSVKSVTQHRNDFSPFPEDKLKTYLATLDQKPKNKIDEKEDNFLMSVSSLVGNDPSSQPSVASNLNAQPIPPQPSLMTQNFSPTVQTGPTIAPQPNMVIQPAAQPTPVVKPAMEQPTPESQPKITSPVLKGISRNIGLPNTPTSPNLIIGITRDARGNALSNILIEIKDKDGNPIRAFKTNELGRFASATPLANGVYTVEFEDPKSQNRFEKLTINAVGQIIMPIEAISVDAREELRMSLFSANTKVN
jgi:hypothetical protein